MRQVALPSIWSGMTKPPSDGGGGGGRGYQCGDGPSNLGSVGLPLVNAWAEASATVCPCLSPGSDGSKPRQRAAGRILPELSYPICRWLDKAQKSHAKDSTSFRWHAALAKDLGELQRTQAIICLQVSIPMGLMRMSPATSYHAWPLLEEHSTERTCQCIKPLLYSQA